MTDIYHVTPITPVPRLLALGPRCYCVSHYEPKQMKYMPQVGARVMIDNGAFSFFTETMRIRAKLAREGLTDREMKRLQWLELPRDWTRFYAFVEQHIFEPGRWAVIPDVIAEGSQAQDALLREWRFGHRGAPVWHTGEPIDRLLRLADTWPRVCIGSTDEHWIVGSDIWVERMDEAWTALLKRHRDPVIHMLRGVDVAHLYPFSSADSSSLGQNGHRYRSPLFPDDAQTFAGSVAYAQRLERVICEDFRQNRENRRKSARLARSRYLPQPAFPGFF